MTFFNRKEEVIEVQLTRQGREKLAMGKFKPASYEFLDEDIIYDKKNAEPNVYEEQNEIKKRNKEKVTLREPTARQGISPKLFKIENKRLESLGTFTPYSNYRPAWRLSCDDGFLLTGSGEIDFTSVEVDKANTKTVVGPSYEKIPQLNLVCQYDYNVFKDIDKEDDESYVFSAALENPFLSLQDLFSEPNHNSFILFDKEFNDFTINVEEKNVIKEKDGFILEVFKYDYQENGTIVQPTKLYFDEVDIRSDSVGWFFNVSLDEEVDLFKDGFTFTNEEITPEAADDECKDV